MIVFCLAKLCDCSLEQGFKISSVKFPWTNFAQPSVQPSVAICTSRATTTSQKPGRGNRSQASDVLFPLASKAFANLVFLFFLFVVYLVRNGASGAAQWFREGFSE